jgi:adenine specific DNA methylase Mod
MRENLLIKGDASDPYGDVLPDDMRFDLVYLDPPFGTDRVFSNREGIVAYDDRIPHVVLGEMIERSVGRIRVWMTDKALLFVHLDWRFIHEAKVTIDRVFGRDNFRGEIIWQSTMPKSVPSFNIQRNHNTILVYGKTDLAKWDAVASALSYDLDNLDEKTLKQYKLKDENGRRYQLTSLINPNHTTPSLNYEFLGVTKYWRWTRERMQAAYERGEVVQSKPGIVPRQKRYLDEQHGKPIGSIWTDIYPMSSTSLDFVDYPTQKPEKLLERIIRGASKEGDVVADLMCGSGTTLAVAHRMKRRFVGMDRGDLAIDTTKKRLDKLGAEYRIVA